MRSRRIIGLCAAGAASLALTGTAPAGPDACAAAEQPAEACVQLQIGLSAGPNPTPAGGTVSFAWSVSVATDCWDNLGHSAWGNYSFQQVVSDPFTWTVWCMGSGVESSSLPISVDAGGGGGGGGGEVPALISAPSVAGTAAVGQSLTANPGSWTNSPTTYHYSWKRHGDLLELGTGSSLALAPEHAGYQLTVDVQACNGTGCSSWARSTATDPIDPFPGGWAYQDQSIVIAAPQEIGSLSCRTVSYRRTARSVLFGTVLFRMHHELQWCWREHEIVEASAVCYSSDVDIAIQASICPTPHGHYFSTWKHVRGGWHSVAENTYRNCLPIFGDLTCWRQSTITLHIYAYAGGQWYGRGGSS